MKKIYLLALAAASMMFATSCEEDDSSDDNGGGGSVEVEGQPEKFVGGEVTSSTTWSADTTYIMTSKVWVTNGATLTIEAGTLVKAAEGANEEAKALIVTRGSKLMAAGTKDEPIIFTSILDNLTKLEDGSFEASTLDPAVFRGLWGGIVVIGNGPTNQDPELTIEGVASDETRGVWGGMVDEVVEDNSGTLTYISIRHGGTSVDADSEINGLSLYAVGRGTTIEHIEVIGNDDDGIEWFGGNVDTKWLLVTDCSDDSYDYDQGFDGRGQFWATFKNGGDVAGEHDGGKPDDATPYATPVVYNATYKGDAAKETIILRDGAGGEYHNSIFDNFAKGIYIEERGTANDTSNNDSYDRLVAGDIKFMNNIVSNTATSGDYLVVKVDGDEAHLDTLDADASISMTVENVTVSESSPGVSTTATPGTPSDSWFTTTDYLGAFDPSGDDWTADWTRFSEVRE